MTIFGMAGPCRAATRTVVCADIAVLHGGSIGISGFAALMSKLRSIVMYRAGRRF
jgi:hypothetical protein